jgi:hypothetical protein
MKYYTREIYRLTARALSLVLMAIATASCINDDVLTNDAENDTYLYLNFFTQEPTVTRAVDNSSEANPATESYIHSLRVWAFPSGNSDESLPIGYKEETISGNATQHTLSMQLPPKVAGRSYDGIDLFILANSESLETLKAADGTNMSLTRGALQSAAIRERFAVTTDGKAMTTEVPESGLPLSRAVTAISLADHLSTSPAEAAAKGIKVPLLRAVSKLHFFVARKANAGTENAHITRIVINGGLLPEYSRVFPDATTYTMTETTGLTATTSVAGLGRVTQTMTLDAIDNAVIAEVSAPATLERNDSESGMDYIGRLTDAGLLSHDRVYLRETDKAISGIIYYKLDSDSRERSAAFSIPGDNSAATRNHELLVYAYFPEGGSLRIKPVVMDWLDGSSVDYSNRIEVKLTRNTYKLSEEDGTSAVAVAYQANGTPSMTPVITVEKLMTSGMAWILQTDNPAFGFYKDGVVSEKITGDGSTTSFSFQVVAREPIDMVNPHNRNARVCLIIPEMGNIKAIINEGDGKLEGTPYEIDFRQVTPDEYQELPEK